MAHEPSQTPSHVPISSNALARSEDTLHALNNGTAQKNRNEKRIRAALSDDSDEELHGYFDDVGDLNSLKDFIEDDLDEVVISPTSGLAPRPKVTDKSGKNVIELDGEEESVSIAFSDATSSLSSSLPDLSVLPGRSALPRDAAAASYNAADEIDGDVDALPGIPRPLLARILHEHFRKKDTRIESEAMGVFVKYVETFAREAIARATFERQEVQEKDNDRKIYSDNFLEVEDLEKLAVQLLLDF